MCANTHSRRLNLCSTLKMTHYLRSRPAYIAPGMAFFFGRLDSHYQKLRIAILAPLYLYAVMQLLGVKHIRR